MKAIKAKDSEENRLIIELVETGSELTGSVGGAVIGTMLAGLPGAIIGAASGTLISKAFKNIGLEIKNRFFSNREEIRIGAAYTFAISKINEKLEAGKRLRNDDFFKKSGKKRPASEEILEGTLLVAQKEYEEEKVRHYGYLIANISFDSKIDRGLANFLLRIAEGMSYRQLCLLELFYDRDKYELYKREMPKPIKFDPFNTALSTITSMPIVNNSRGFRVPLEYRRFDLSLEMKELERIGLLELGTVVMGDYSNVKPTSLGNLLRDLMELDVINKSDIEEIATVLRFVDNGSFQW